MYSQISSPAVPSNNNSNGNINSSSNSQNLSITLGSPVIIGKGNITATAVDPHTGRIM